MTAPKADQPLFQRTGKPGPLSGVKVIDLTSALMGPYCTQILSDLGADVIKVEGPEGDTTRWLPPGRHPDRGGMFVNLNRGKRSIVLDLKSAAGHAALLRLIADADVFIHSMRLQAIERLGLDEASLRSTNDRLIHANLYGFGRGGPYSDLPAYDDVIQAASGLALLQAEATGREPEYLASTVADQVAALTGVYAITAALFERTRSGRGQEVEVPMFETTVSFVLAQHLGGAAYDPPLGRPVYQRAVSRYRRPYRTADGYVSVLIYKDKHWRNFFTAIGDPPWSRSPKFSSLARRTEHIDEIYEQLDKLMLERTTQAWIDVFRRAEIPAMRLAATSELLDDPHLDAVGFWQRSSDGDGDLRLPGIPTKFSRTPGHIGAADQGLGHSGRAILKEHGFSAAEIDAVLGPEAVDPVGGKPTAAWQATTAAQERN